MLEEGKKFFDISDDVSMKNNNIVIVDENGKEVKCDVLFTFECDNNNRNYVGFTDNTRNKKGELNIYAAYLDILLDDGSLRNVETDEEIEMVNDVIKKIQEEMRK